MNTEDLKIQAYASSVKSLPDYPSDEGYTAEMLKAVFDARSDNEIKEKHNALVDAVKVAILELQAADGSVEERLQEVATMLYKVADSDDETLDSLSEIVAYIKQNREDIEGVSRLLANSVTFADIGTEDKAGVFKLASVPDAAEGATKEAVLTPYHMEAIFAGRIPKHTVTSDEDDRGGNFPPSADYMKEYVGGIVGDVSSALDELHAYATSLSGGAE